MLMFYVEFGRERGHLGGLTCGASEIIENPKTGKAKKPLLMRDELKGVGLSREKAPTATSTGICGRNSFIRTV